MFFCAACELAEGVIEEFQILYLFAIKAYCTFLGTVAFGVVCPLQFAANVIGHAFPATGGIVVNTGVSADGIGDTYCVAFGIVVKLLDITPVTDGD